MIAIIFNELSVTPFRGTWKKSYAIKEQYPGHYNQHMPYLSDELPVELLEGGGCPIKTTSFVGAAMFYMTFIFSELFTLYEIRLV